MKQLSNVLAELAGEPVHYCPGCEQLHRFSITKPNDCGAKWTFDGNVMSPTFFPSMNIVGSCHYFLRAGKIQFLSDCRHKLAGQTIPLPELPDWAKDCCS